MYSMSTQKGAGGRKIRLDLTRDIQSLTTFRRRSGDFLKQLRKSKRPVVLTVKGRAAAVAQDAGAYQRLLDIAAAADARGLRARHLLYGRKPRIYRVIYRVNRRHEASLCAPHPSRRAAKIQEYGHLVSTNPRGAYLTIRRPYMPGYLPRNINTKSMLSPIPCAMIGTARLRPVRR
jgi:prevent-host-death family protein